MPNKSQKKRPGEPVGEGPILVAVDFSDDSGIKSLEDAKTRLVAGLPVTRIIEVADKIGARMIVMGGRGRTGLGHLLVGSKAGQGVQLSPIPVTIVKAGKAIQGKAKKK